MDVDRRSRKGPEFIPERIEWYLCHAHQLRSEAVAYSIARLLARLRNGSKRVLVRSDVAGPLPPSSSPHR